MSRDKLTVAAKLRKADPEIAEKVLQGELPLEEAADKVGVVRKKQVKPSVPKPAKTEPIKKAVKGKPTGNQSLWKDEFTEITDTPDGLRTLRCDNATFCIHTTAAVMPEVDQWWWYAGTEDDQGIEEHREDAEKSVLGWFSASRKNDA